MNLSLFSERQFISSSQVVNYKLFVIVKPVQFNALAMFSRQLVGIPDSINTLVRSSPLFANKGFGNYVSITVTFRSWAPNCRQRKLLNSIKPLFTIEQFKVPYSWSIWTLFDQLLRCYFYWFIASNLLVLPHSLIHCPYCLGSPTRACTKQKHVELRTLLCGPMSASPV